MMYIENIFVLIAAPLAACLFCVRGRPRAIVASLLVGRYAGAAIGAAVAFTVGVLKEYLNDDHVDKDDIKADIIGSVSGALLSII